MRIARFLALVFLLAAMPKLSFCQANAVSVDYLCKVHSLKTGINKKVPLKRMIYTDDTSYIEEDSILQDNLLSHVSFEKNKNIRAFAKCSYTVFDNDSPAGLIIHTPDTVRFCNGQWTSMAHSGSKNIPAKKTSIRNLKENKVILGYLCVKFLVYEADTGAKYFVWANSSLPKTLIPVPGLTGFKYGILEVSDINGTWSVVATKIVKLK